MLTYSTSILLSFPVSLQGGKVSILGGKFSNHARISVGVLSCFVRNKLDVSGKSSGISLKYYLNFFESAQLYRQKFRY